MIKNLANFMVFKVKETGEGKQFELTEEEFSKQNSSSLFTDTEVILIVKESIRRIYIWKGIASSVRKKFIGSHVGQMLQKELMTNGNFHRCKIVSVDQGEEPQEFLDNFNLQRSEGNHLVKKREQIERERMEQYSKVQLSRRAPPKGLISHNTSQIGQNTTLTQYNNARELNKERSLRQKRNNKKVLKTILEKKISEDYVRKHIIIGDINLYGIVEKKSRLFDKDIKEHEWEPIRRFPEENIELKNYCFRIHIDIKTNTIRGIEALKDLSELERKTSTQEYKFSYWTISNLRKYCKENDIEIPTGALKEDIISLVKEYANSN